jgi:CDP-ribitol ribitolphosphotransferase
MKAQSIKYLLLLILFSPFELLGLIVFVITYAIKRFLSRKNRRIVFISHQEDLPDDDDANCFVCLKQTLAAYGYEIIPKMKRNVQSRRFSFLITFVSQAMSTARANVVVTDGYSIPARYLAMLPSLKNTLSTIQIWHAIGAIKRFNGNGFEKHLLGAHRGYTYVLAPSKSTAEFYAEAFDIEIDRVKIIGAPLLDILHSGIYNKREEILSARPDIAEAINAGKKIIVYLPTYRDKSTNTVMTSVDAICKLDSELNSESFYLVSKLHPIDAAGDATLTSDFQAEELLYAADCVITDYSSLAIDAALLGKPLFFYPYDIDKYQDSPGLNINPETEYGNYASRDASELASIIQRAFETGYDKAYEKSFADKYIETYDGRCTERLTKLILNCISKTRNANDK